MRLSAFVSVALALFMVAAPARAITNQDVLGMPSQERYAYITASVDMVAFMASVAGNRERSQCIVEWFFRSEGRAATVVQAMNNNLDHTPQALIYLLINRQCGEPAAGATPRRPITNEDVLSMPFGESYAYIAASIEMVGFMASVAGDRERSQCIVEWFFRTESGPATVDQAMDRFRDRTPQALIYLLINRQCGEPDAAGQ